MKTVLVRALSASVCHKQRAVARRFLQGLSFDELQYIADYFGACVLEAANERDGTGWEGIAAFERCRHPHPRRSEALADHEHKMILLVEYLCRCGLTQSLPALRVTGQPG